MNSNPFPPPRKDGDESDEDYEEEECGEANL
jgi:hypothetical protein